MIYLIVQIWIWLVVAAIIGFVAGWLLRWRLALERIDRLEDDLIMLRAARDRLEQDNKRLLARPSAADAAVPPGRPAADPADTAADTAAGGKVGLASGGMRPPALPGPRGGQADDLQRIDGIGPKIEEVLHQLGIYHFDQIAAWTRQHVDWVDGYLRFKGRIDREGWVAQARQLAGGGSGAARNPFAGDQNERLV